MPVLLLQGCAGTEPIAGRTAGATFVDSLPAASPAGAENKDLLAALALAKSGVGDSEFQPTLDYKIGSLDILEVSVFGVPELTKTVQVSASGQVMLPLIKAIVARGRTTAELEQEIAQKLGETYLKSPQVSVTVKEAVSQRVTVGGAVKQPGVFPIAGQTTLLQTIALAQGLQPIADPSRVLIFRYSGAQSMAARFDVTAIGGKEADPVVAPGDVVMVDQWSGRTAVRDTTQKLPIASFFVPLMSLLLL